MSYNAYKPKSHGGGSSSSNTNNHDMAKIFVGGLSWQTTEETLRYHFEQYGEVVSVEVMRDRNTGDPRGFAFVVFKDDTTVDLVMSNLPHEINHKVVDVKRAQARGT
jgi:RNA-binding protein Musashi